MHEDWNAPSDAGGGPYPFDGAQAERVVPADGDPEAEAYRAHRHKQLPPRPALSWWTGGVARPRHRWRRWLVVGAVIVLSLVLIKPLLVVATIAVAVLLGMLAVGMLAIGALLLAVRFILGGRFAYLGGRGPMRAGRFGGPRWFE